MSFVEANCAKERLAKHSTFRVGAYLEGDWHNLSAGNVEHGSSRLTLCAETILIANAKMLSVTPKHLHIVTDNDKPTFPCGLCREYIGEFPKLRVTCYSKDGTKKVTKTARQLLPNPYKRNK